MNAEATALLNFQTLKQKIDHILLLDMITLQDIQYLKPLERQYLGERCTEMVNQLTGAEREHFLDKISLIIPAATKAEVWENNHLTITNAVSRFMRDNGMMPTKSIIAEKTGLSRQTVAKHLKEYQLHPNLPQKMEQFKFMVPKVLANVFNFAVTGDIRAARLYFEMVSAVNKRRCNTVVNEQNNYIQINNTILSQENLKQLTADQLKPDRKHHH